MTERNIDEQKLDEFIDYVSHLKGYEKGEAQLFLDRLFIAFGHKGVLEANASLEQPIVVDTQTKFCDLLWPGKVLIEMKKRGEPLEKHFSQAKMYWDNAYEKRPEYVILSNFDEFLIYNWNLQRDPLDRVPIVKLKEMWRSLAFLCPKHIEPIFGNNRVAVTKEAGDRISQLYIKLIQRGISAEKALRFTLQCLIALFAEDTGLFSNRYLFSELVEACGKGFFTTYELFPLLFEKMNSPEAAEAGRFKDVMYFNGGIFSKIYRIELNNEELDILDAACKYDWSKVQPSIFGNIFESSFDAAMRHTTGAHYTPESDIMRVVEPTILRPWREKIAAARTLVELETIWEELSRYQVLDPACGSGNFLYIAFRELKHLELDLLQQMFELYPSFKRTYIYSKISCNQFFGIDTNPLGIELAKITLSMAKKFACDNLDALTKQLRFWGEHDAPLPFDNLDNNFINDDALFVEWPQADAIIGNPPYQSKNKMGEEFGADYVQQLRRRFLEVSGYSDYCVYWFRKAHDTLLEGGRAGLVGTNTISQTNSREGGLDYIVANQGTILDAIASMPWGGSAAVHVAIVNWIKGKTSAKKFTLARQNGTRKDGPWEVYELSHIPSSLSPLTDVTKAVLLRANTVSKLCFQGLTHGVKGFLLSPAERSALLKAEPDAADVTYPFLIAEELIGSVDSLPKRFVIDFQPRHDLSEVMRYQRTYNLIKERVLPEIEVKAEREEKRYNRRLGQLQRWWLLRRRKEELIAKLNEIERYIACSRVAKRPIFEFVSSNIRPNDAIIAFPLPDDYSFGILQSSFHWEWTKARCSTLTERYRYTTDTVFDTFPWPQWSNDLVNNDDKKPSEREALRIDTAAHVAEKARELRALRNRIRTDNGSSLRELYRSLEVPGTNALREAHEKLDRAVREAYLYGMPKQMAKLSALELLLKLNESCASKEQSGATVVGPGLPDFCTDHSRFYSADCINLK